MPAPSRSDLDDAARQFFELLTKEFDQPRDFPLEDWENQIAHQLELTRERIGELDQQLITKKFDPKIAVRASTMIAEMGNELNALDEPDQQYVMQVTARAERESLELFTHQLLHPAQAYETRDELFRKVKYGASPAPAAPLPESASTLLTRTIDLYLERLKKSRLSQSRVDETGRVLRWLVQRAGGDKRLADIDKSEMRRFRDDIERLDGSLQGRKAHFNERQTDSAKRQIKSVTAVRYWRSITGFFSWAAEEGYVENDPTSGLKVAAKKGQVKRTPEAFEQSELQALFATPLFAGHKSGKRVLDAGEFHFRRGEWWSALLFAYTGMRAAELNQLTSSDFVFEHEVPHLKVRRENSEGDLTKTTKNEASIRDIPLAPVLIELGLEQFVRIRSKSERLFFEFRFGSGGRRSDGLTKFWLRYLKRFGLWKPGRSTHVWRHTVVACLRRNGVNEDDIGAFVGHSGKTVTSGYGGAHPLKRKLATLQNLDYGFDTLDALGGPFVKTLHL